MSSNNEELFYPLPTSDGDEQLDAPSNFYELFVEMIEGESPVFPKDIDERIANLPNHRKRLNLLHQFTFDTIEKYASKSKRSSKDDTEAITYMNQGHLKCMKGEFLNSLEEYNNSIKFAATNKVLELAYGLRSQLFYKMKLRKECLADTERALGYGVSDDEREECLEYRRAETRNWPMCFQKHHEGVPTYVGPNAKIQSASKCIEITSSPKYGRHIVATEDIKPGKLLVVEKPFSTKICPSDFQHCHECFKLCYDLIPCDFCTNTLYCNESCKSKAYKTYHQYECIVLAYGKNLGLVPKDMWPLKLTITTNAMLPLSSNDKELYRSDRYHEISNLHDIAKFASKGLKTMWLTRCCFIYHLVKYYTDYFVGPEKHQLEENFKERLVKLFGLCLNTPLPINELKENKVMHIYHSSEIGLGLYALGCLFNHACQPNVTAVFYGTTLVLRSLCSIQKGEQCFLSYGVQYDKFTLNQRQSFLSNCYNFTCECRACKENWPQLDGLVSKTPFWTTCEGPLFVKDCIEATESQKARQMVPRVISNLQKVEKDSPCLEVAFLTRALEHCYKLFGNVKRQL